MTTTPMRERFYAELGDILDADPRVASVFAVIGSASIADTAARHPGRVIDVGIREQAMVGVAGGLALAGMRPIVHTYAPFLVERAYEQVKLDLGHQGVSALLVSTGASYDASTAGRTHQAPADVALISALPGWSVQVPGTSEELSRIVRREASRDTSVYVRMSTLHNARSHPVDGRLHLVRGGAHDLPLVVAVGPILDTVLAATTDLPVRVAYTSTPYPLDAAGLRTLAGPTPAITFVEPYLEGTSAPAVSSALSDRPSRVTYVGVPRHAELRRYGSPKDHAAAHGLDATGIRARVKELLR